MTLPTAEIENRAAIYINNWNKKQREKESRVRDSGVRIFDSGIWVDKKNGDLYIATYQPLTVEDLSGYTRVYPTHPSADPQAEGTVFKDHRERLWMKSEDLRSAKRKVRDHILKNTRGRERKQVEAGFELVERLSDVYTYDFKQLSFADLEELREKSEITFESAGMHPARLKVQTKKSMAERILRSSGPDSRGRKNWLVMVSRIWAAEGDIARRKESLARIDYKYTGILVAIYEIEALAVGMFSNMSDRLRDDGRILKTVLFTKENISQAELRIQINVIDKIIERMIEQIEPFIFPEPDAAQQGDQLVLPKPFKDPGAKAIYKLTCARIQLGRVKRLYEEGKPAEAVALWKDIRKSTKEYLQWTRNEDIQKTLDDYTESEKTDLELPIAA